MGAKNEASFEGNGFWLLYRWCGRTLRYNAYRMAMRTRREEVEYDKFVIVTYVQTTHLCSTQLLIAGQTWFFNLG